MNSNDITHQIIISGHFSKNGNFIGISSNDDVIHIYKVQMDLLNLKSKGDITFPIFVTSVVKSFDKLSGEPGDTERKQIFNSDGAIQRFDRLTAVAIFKDFDSLVDAYAVESALNFDYNLEVVKEYTIEAQNAFKEYFEYRISINKL